MQTSTRYYLTPSMVLGKFTSLSGNLYNLKLPSGKVVAFHPGYLTFVSTDRVLTKNNRSILKLSAL